MKIEIAKNVNIKCEILALGLFSDDVNKYKELNPVLHDEIQNAIAKKIFETDFGKTYITSITGSTYTKIAVISLGKHDDLTADDVRKLTAKLVALAKVSKLYTVTTNIIDMLHDKFDNNTLGRLAAEGAILADYKFDKYLAKKDTKEVTVHFAFENKDSAFDFGINEGKIIATNTNFVKDLVNEPANVVTPSYIESVARKIAQDKRIKITVLGRKEIKEKGLGALLGVSAGSDIEPKLIIMEYNGAKGASKKEKLAIVGKGITFDSGGYDIKPAGQFTDMKCDMAGAGAVLGTLKNALELNIEENIIGVIPTCENLINGSAQKPGDIVRAYNGKTIEIGNTDAEGRLILADAISYVEKNYNPTTIIDLATLTGACVVALGSYAAGLFSNNDELQTSLVQAGNASYDRVWPLPFYKEYQDHMDGDIADLKNISAKGPRGPGAITGAVFVSKFVDKAKWAHIDIAGTAFLSEAKEYNQKYASGAGVRLLTYYLMHKSM